MYDDFLKNYNTILQSQYTTFSLKKQPFFFVFQDFSAQNRTFLKKIVREKIPLPRKASVDYLREAIASENAVCTSASLSALEYSFASTSVKSEVGKSPAAFGDLISSPRQNCVGTPPIL